MDISNQINIFKRDSFSKKINLYAFLEKLEIHNHLSINDYITDEILTLERKKNKDPTYTYWVDGGLSWFYWYNENFDINPINFDSVMSMSICNLKFNYIFNDFNIWHDKIIKLYNITNKLNTILKNKGIICELICTNFDYNPNSYPSFDSFYTFQNDEKKNPFYNIKLIFKSYNGSIDMEKEGGAKPPKKSKFSREEIKNKFKKALNQLKQKRLDIKEQVDQEILTLNDFKSKLENFDFSNINLLNNKIIVEFQLEYYNPSKLTNQVFNIQKFKDFYLVNQSKELIESDTVQIFPSLYKRQFLNRLNYFGLITISILNTSKAETKIEPESEININAIRQKIFLNKFLNINREDFNNIKPQLDLIYNDLFKSNILNTITYDTDKELIVIAILDIIISYYNLLHSKYLNFNLFFGEKVTNIKYEFVYNYYTKFIDFIDRYFMILFRPVVNAFVREVNQELFDKHKIKLFIAGGDSMRRYNYNSSFTADIDTKLHFKNAQPEYSGQNSFQIKQSIHNIIIKHLVILRNYFEENKNNNILSDFVSPTNKGIGVFKCNHNNINIEIDVLDKNLQFRTRKIDKNITMPVDLYSLDFRYTVKIIDDNTPNKFRRLYNYKRQVALLDIVFGDDKNFIETDLIEINGVAYASKKFLLKDFETTYTNEHMALGRISNGKVDKDIIRYNEINDNSISKYINNVKLVQISKEISDFIELISIRKELNEFHNYLKLNERLYEIIIKLKNKNQLTNQDILVINNLLINDINIINNYLPNLSLLLKEIWEEEIIPKQIRDLIEYKDIRKDIKEFYDTLSNIPELNELFIKIGNKERLNIHDFFIINDICNNKFKINIDEIKTFLPNIAELFEQIINFKINLPFEKLNIYDIEYHIYSQLNNRTIFSNKFYIVFDNLCRLNLDSNEDTNFKHAVSYSEANINKLYESIINPYEKSALKSINIKQDCLVVSKTSISMQIKKDSQAKTKKDNKEKEIAFAQQKKLEEELKKQQQNSSREARSKARSARK